MLRRTGYRVAIHRLPFLRGRLLLKLGGNTQLYTLFCHRVAKMKHGVEKNIRVSFAHHPQ